LALEVKLTDIVGEDREKDASLASSRSRFDWPNRRGRVGGKNPVSTSSEMRIYISKEPLEPQPLFLFDFEGRPFEFWLARGGAGYLPSGFGRLKRSFRK